MAENKATVVTGNVLDFVSEVFGALTAILLDSDIYFLGTQVAELLGYKNPRKAIIDHVWQEDRKPLKYKACNDSLRAKIFGTKDFMDKTLITKEGVLSLIFESQMPKAHDFRRWLLETVIPSLMENGGYIVNQEKLTESDREALMEEIKSLREKVLKRDKKIQSLQMTTDQLTYDLGVSKQNSRSLQMQIDDMREKCYDYGL